MASNINPNNINGQFPIAGQDNDSQGFRDNFTNIASNFTFAQTEISALQANTVLRGAGSTTSLSSAVLSDVETLRFTEVVPTELTDTTSGTLTLSWSNGSLQRITATTAPFTITLDWTSVPLNTYAKIRLWVTVSDIAHTITLPASVTVGVTEISGLNPSSNVLTPLSATDYILEFSLVNDGSNTATVQLVVGPGNDTANVVRTTTFNDMSGNVIAGISESALTYSASSGTVNIDYSDADFHYIPISGNVTLSFSDWPTTANTYSKLRSLVSISTPNTITFPSEVSIGLDAIPGVSGQTLTPASSGDYLFEFGTIDAGTTIMVSALIQPA